MSIINIKLKLDKATKNLVKKVANDVLKEARTQSPVDKGDLRDSHRVEKINDLEYIVGPDTGYLISKRGKNYAEHVYYGTVHSTYTIPANKWLLRAADKVKPSGSDLEL